MRNLKRVLALAMAMVMILGMMVIGTSAASYADEAAIDADYAEAVEVLSNIGVFRGTGNGFAPKQILDRASAATLIYRVITGDVNDKQVQNYDYASLKDVKAGQWYTGYVTYANNGGYIKGDENGNFNPNAQVTGVQVMAIMLRAAGYGQNGEYEGAGWMDNILTDAKKVGITGNISTATLMAPASRELVAQLIFNAITSVDMVNYNMLLGYTKVNNGTILTPVYQTLGENVFGLEKTTGIIEAVGRKAGTTQMNVDGKLDTIVGTNTPWTDIGYAASVWTITTANAKTRTAVSDVTITGESLAVSTDGTAFSVLTGTSPKAVAGLDLIDGYDIYYNGVKMTAATNTTAAVDTIKDAEDRIDHKGVKVDFVDNDNSGLAEAVIVTDYTVATVNGIANDYNTGANAIVKDTYYLSNATVKASDLVCDTELAVGDLVTYVVYGGDTYVTVAPAATGTYTQANFSATTRQYESYVIGGNTYELACEDCKFRSNKDLLDYANIAAKKDLTVFTDPYGYVILVTDAYVAADYLYVVRTNHSDNVAGTTYATVAYPDGTTANVYLKKNNVNFFWTVDPDMYTYTTKDGSIVLGDDCNTSNTDNMSEIFVALYENGDVNLADGVYLTSASVIVDIRDVVNNNKRAAEGVVYTGFDQVPGLKDAVFHVVTDQYGFVKLAFLTDGTNTADLSKEFVVYHTNTHYYYNDGKTSYYNLNVITDGKVDTIVLNDTQYAHVCALGVGIYEYDENAQLTYTSFEEGWADVTWQNNAIVVDGKGYSYTSDVNFFTMDIANGKVYPYAMNQGNDAKAYVVTNKGVATDIYVIYGEVATNGTAAGYTKAVEGGTVSYSAKPGYVTDATLTETATYTVTVDGTPTWTVKAGTEITLPTAANGTGVKVTVDGKDSYAEYGSKLTITTNTAIETGYVNFEIDGVATAVEYNDTVNVSTLTANGTYVLNDYTTDWNMKCVADDNIIAGGVNHFITTGYYKVTVNNVSAQTVTVNGEVETAATFYVTAADKVVVNAPGAKDKTYGVEAPISGDITINCALET